MSTNLVLENDDIFCGDTFVMTVDRFDTIDITVKEGRLYINNTFVKEFADSETASGAIEELISSLKTESLDYDIYIAA